MLVRKSQDEAKRLDLLSGYDILDSAPEAAFDRITRLAQAAIGAPIAMISLIDANRQWIKSGQGTMIGEIPRNISICAQVIEGNEPLVVPDLRDDDRFLTNPLIAGEPNIRFYAGVPLTASGGLRVGTLSVADTEPRNPSHAEIGHLHDLARLTIDLFEFRKMALSDSLTGLCTRRAFLAEAARQVASARRSSSALGCITFDIDRFRSINDSYGTAAGDVILQMIAEICRRELRKIDIASRVGSEEFGVLLPETGTEGAMRVAERLREAIAATTVIYAGHRIQFTVSLGISVLGANEENALGLISRSEQALRESKHNGRNRTAILVPPGDQLEAPQRARIAVRR
jgi:diguanylate cyclase (GGDEF)-like protein